MGLISLMLTFVFLNYCVLYDNIQVSVYSICLDYDIAHLEGY